MTSSPQAAELELFRTALGQRLGLHFEPARLGFLGDVLQQRLQARSTSAAPYLEALLTERETEGELALLARELTVGETYFFRHAEQLDAFRELVLPERVAALGASRPVRLLSLGCASGEEPYTLAILSQERGFAAGEVSIRGVDVNPEALAKARRGVYSAWSLRDTPDVIRRRWFTNKDKNFRVAASLQRAIELQQHNLVCPSPELFARESVDIVFCRNVLMYFTPEQARAVIERVTFALAPGGFLFMGHAETLRGLSQSFQLQHSHNAFYYQRKRTSQLAALSSAQDVAWSQPAQAVVSPSLPPSDTHSLPSLRSPPSTLVGPIHEPPRAMALEAAWSLLRSERFSEALAAIQLLPEVEASAPPALLLRAALLTHQGELASAELTCRKLLEIDELNAGAHYLLALCHERRGHLPAALEHDRTAAYLDSGFAMPHLHLGLMARRRRDVVAARHELGQALWLLEREDAARLLLFGGGFTRSALLSLCRSELAGLGASS